MAENPIHEPQSTKHSVKFELEACKAPQHWTVRQRKQFSEVINHASQLDNAECGGCQKSTHLNKYSKWVPNVKRSVEKDS